MVNVSDAFVARYERAARDVDPVLAEPLRAGRTAYNLAMMSPRGPLTHVFDELIAVEDHVADEGRHPRRHLRHAADAPMLREAGGP
jgi:hypothetical protein